MFGFIVGTLCLIGLVKVLRRSHGYGCGGYGHHGQWHGCGPGFGSGGHGTHGMGRRWALRWLFERLETMPGQERAILQALDRLTENRALFRDELRQSRADVARAIEGGLIEDGTLEETFARHDRLVAQVRVSIVEALKQITEVLDERQRKELAAILGRGGLWGMGMGMGGGGPWAPSGGPGPYRGWM